MGDYIKDFLDIENKLFAKKLQLFGGGESDKTIFCYYPPSSGISSCDQTIDMVMCLHTRCSPAV